MEKQTKSYEHKNLFKKEKSKRVYKIKNDDARNQISLCFYWKLEYLCITIKMDGVCSQKFLSKFFLFIKIINLKNKREEIYLLRDMNRKFELIVF